ncbi:hypothetical protein IC232_28170 [Microvirga sp. BT688]|uniref:hypothetical protein n=1 Tax=Microvirga sp. TaxID=1873136 RepID=UPI00168394E8|nr:hypothetical protein [Microvirga sp.]MBD2750531.1 hypothetical protein [Microvirga sp.]
MFSDHKRRKHLGSGTDIYMAGDAGNPTMCHTDRDLLEDEAVGADFGIRMDNDTVRVRNKEAAADLAVKGYIDPCHDAPETVTQHGPTPL